jgi:hypothetical protein
MPFAVPLPSSIPHILLDARPKGPDLRSGHRFRILCDIAIARTALLREALRDAQVVAAGIEETKISQTPRALHKLLLHWPTGHPDVLEHAVDVVDLKNELDTHRRPSAVPVQHLRPSSGAYLNTVALQGQVRLVGVAFIPD